SSARYLVGTVRHGYGKWAEIAYDPELALAAPLQAAVRQAEASRQPKPKLPAAVRARSNPPHGSRTRRPTHRKHRARLYWHRRRRLLPLPWRHGWRRGLKRRMARKPG